MTTIESAFINALLADAAYVNLLNEPLNSSGNLGLLGDRMTPTLAAYIAANFEVASSINSSDNPLTGGSGFDATVWRGKAGGDYAGQIFVSTRGTEPGAGGSDLLADVDLALALGARAQIIDMANWWLKISTPMGQSARQIRLEPIYDNSTPPVELGTRIVLTSPAAGLGLLTAAELAQGVQAQGHSLGGHLATAFARTFGGNNSVTGSVNVRSVSTFNSAGFNGSAAENLFKDIQNLLGTGSTSFGPVSAKQTNYFAANGINVTTNTWWFTQMGTRTGLCQEETTGSGNHSMYRLTDLLALGRALEKLDRFFTLDNLNALSKFGSNVPEASLEGVLDGLRRTLMGPNIAPLPAGDAPDSDADRMLFHATMKALTDSAAFKSLEGKVGIYLPIYPDMARGSFADVVALETLSPFVLGGNSPSLDTFWRNSIWSTAYQGWLADIEAVSVRGEPAVNFTSNYLNDRQALLQNLIAANIKDTQANAQGFLAVRDGLSNSNKTSFIDMATGTRVQTNAGLNSASNKLVIFGDANANIINGSGQADRLYGGAGVDTLNGLGGNDYLEGGTGTDTYQFDGAFGNDSVLDTDGLGSIRIDNVTLSGGKKRDGSGNVWVSDDKASLYTLRGSDLIITQTGGSGGSITIKNWQTLGGNKLGIALEDTAVPTTPATGALFYNGDRRAKLIGAETQPGVTAADPTFGTYAWAETSWATDGSLTNGVSQAGFADVIGATAAGANGSVIHGYGGNDALSGSIGQDDIFGDEGDDLIGGGAGSDNIRGGDGNDTILSATTLDATYQRSKPTDQFNLPAGSTVRTAGPTWATYYKANGELVIAGAGSMAMDSAADVVDAGAGNDVIVTGKGVDTILAGTGNDYAWGGEGSDIVEGEDGNDVLLGDGSTTAGLYQSTEAAGHGADFIDGGAGASRSDTDTIYLITNYSILTGTSGNSYTEYMGVKAFESRSTHIWICKRRGHSTRQKMRRCRPQVARKTKHSSVVTTAMQWEHRYV